LFDTNCLSTSPTTITSNCSKIAGDQEERVAVQREAMFSLLFPSPIFQGLFSRQIKILNKIDYLCLERLHEALLAGETFNKSFLVKT
jgi:hypoxanthine-guanine phosphoribosyltransferase